MVYDKKVMDILIAKFKPFINRAGGGIFTRKTRERLLRIRPASGRNRTKNDFWYDVRNRVKNALMDLDLFIQMSEKEQVNQVVTKETLEPVITSLLGGFALFPKGEPDPNLAKISEMLIHWAFDYLQHKTPESMTLAHSRTIEEAEDLSRYLRRTIAGGF